MTRRLSPFAIKVRAEARWTRYVVETSGKETDATALSKLEEQLERYLAASDQRGLKFVQDAMRDLRANILWNQQWYWSNIHRYVHRPGARFLNQAQAAQWIQKADAAEAITKWRRRPGEPCSGGAVIALM